MALASPGMGRVSLEPIRIGLHDFSVREKQQPDLVSRHAGDKRLGVVMMPRRAHAASHCDFSTAAQMTAPSGKQRSWI